MRMRASTTEKLAKLVAKVRKIRAYRGSSLIGSWKGRNQAWTAIKLLRKAYPTLDAEGYIFKGRTDPLGKSYLYCEFRPPVHTIAEPVASKPESPRRLDPIVRSPILVEDAMRIPVQAIDMSRQLEIPVPGKLPPTGRKAQKVKKNEEVEAIRTLLPLIHREDSWCKVRRFSNPKKAYDIRQKLVQDKGLSSQYDFAARSEEAGSDCYVWAKVK